MDPKPVSPLQGSKYDMRLNPVYQIDFQNCASGRRISVTKRRVRFRFGFSNANAIARGLTGTECRGEEHEVNLVWSVTSGKRLVLADGHEVHFSKGGRTEGKFETSWTISGSHTLKLIAYAAPPIVVTPDFRQFDLILDGLSFFDMPHIYELGKTNSSQAMVVSTSSSYGYSSDSFSQEDNSVQFAKAPSTRSLPDKERRAQFAETPRRESAPAVLDLLQDAPKDHLDTTLMTPVQDEFSPVAPTSATPSLALVSNQIMSSYAAPLVTPTALPALTNEPCNAPAAYKYPTSPQPVYEQVQQPPPVYSYYQPQPHQEPVYQQQRWEPHPGQPVSPEFPAQGSVNQVPVVVASPSMQPLNVHELQGEPPKTEMEQALETLVNLSDITETVETPEQIKAKQSKMKNAPAKSEPLPPAQPDWRLGMNACLSDIRKHGQPKAAPAKEIMRTHAFDPAAVHAGMMVVYGVPAATQGFGAGVHPPYQQQQVMSRAF